jgi:hypothetical protein
MPWRPTANPWVIAAVVALAAVMEVLDTSIANVALPYMAGNVVQRVPVKIVFDQGQDAEHLLRLGMSVEPNVRVR